MEDENVQSDDIAGPWVVRPILNIVEYPLLVGFVRY